MYMYMYIAYLKHLIVEVLVSKKELSTKTKYLYQHVMLSN